MMVRNLVRVVFAVVTGIVMAGVWRFLLFASFAFGIAGRFAFGGIIIAMIVLWGGMLSNMIMNTINGR